MAAALLAHKKLENVAVQSAGVYAAEGEPMSQHAQMTLAKYAISAAHMSSQVSEPALKWADLILTMTTRHKQLLTVQYPEVATKIYTLNEYVYGQSVDVLDPYGGDLAIYEQTYKELTATIEQLVIKLQKEA